MRAQEPTHANRFSMKPHIWIFWICQFSNRLKIDSRVVQTYHLKRSLPEEGEEATTTGRIDCALCKWVHISAVPACLLLCPKCVLLAKI